MQHELERGRGPTRAQAFGDGKLRDEQADGKERARPGRGGEQRREALDGQRYFHPQGKEQHGERDRPDERAARDARERAIAEESIGLARELGDEAQHAVADEEERRYLAAWPRLG